MTSNVIAALVLVVCVQLASTQMSMSSGSFKGPMPGLMPGPMPGLMPGPMLGPMPGPMLGAMPGRANMPTNPMPFASMRSISKDFTFPGQQIFPITPRAKENSIYPDLASLLLLQKGMGASAEPRLSTMQQQSSFLPFMMAGNMIEEEMLPFFLMSRGM